MHWPGRLLRGQRIYSIRNCMRRLAKTNTDGVSLYSVLKFFAGFANAALVEWNVAVSTAVSTITKADTINGITDKPAL